MKNILLQMIFIFLMATLAKAGNSCATAENINTLTNISSTQTHILNGSISASQTEKYYVFTPRNNGRLTFNYKSDANTDIYIKLTTAGCATDPELIYNSKSKKDTRSFGTTIDVGRKEKVLIRVVKRGGGSVPFVMEFEFDTDGFHKDYHQSINGDIEVIGNSSLLVRGGGCLPDNVHNDDAYAINAHSDTATAGLVNSSSAKLTIPNGAKVVYATLYWQGYFAPANSIKKENSKSVKLKSAGSSTYREITTDNRYEWINVPTGNRYVYQGVADVTQYVRRSGDYTVANIHTDVGDVSGGAFGGWALVVVYEHESKSYKNITIFDGLGIISGGNYKSYDLSGFLTTRDTKEAVNSTFYYFAGEGDFGLSGDYVSLSKRDVNGSDIKLFNKVKPENNLFNSRISKGDHMVLDRNPSCKNTMGIDIGSFNVGTGKGAQNIIGHGQTSTRVKLATDGDKYFPGMFAFATDLYKPNLCYTNQKVFIVEKNGSEKEIKPNTSLNPNSKIRVEANIKNKSSDESAYKVSLSHDFKADSPYQKGTLQMDDANVTDLQDEDLAYFDPTINRIYFNLGVGATPNQGGEIATGGVSKKISFIRDLNGSGDLTLKYQIDYSNTIDPSTPPDLTGNQIFECDGKQDFKIKVSGSPKIAIFDKVDGNDKNQTYTKIVGQKDVWYKVVVPKGLLDKYWENSNPVLTILFDGNEVNSTRLRDEPKHFILKDNFKMATKSIRFEYRVGSGISSEDNASEIEGFYDETDESFSIRPAKLMIGLAGGGDRFTGVVKESNLAIDTIKALSLDQVTTAPSYNTAIALDGAFSTTLSGTACSVSSVVPKDDRSIVVDYENSIIKNGKAEFVNGEGTINIDGKIAFDEVGDFNLTLMDLSWTDDDRDHGRCEANSSRNTPINGKVGCDLIGSIPVHILPKQFRVKLASRGSNDQNWSYMSEAPDYNGSDLSAMRLDGSIEGYLNSSSDLATNLTKGCYSPDIAVKLDYSGSKFSIPSDRFVDDLNITNNVSINSYDHNFSAGWSDGTTSRNGQFINSVARFNILASVTRRFDNPREPVKLEDLDIRLQLPAFENIGASSEMVGDDLHITLLDQNPATVNIDSFRYTHYFYYGRVYAHPKIKTATKRVKVKYYNEIYCPDGNCIGVSSEILNKDWRVPKDEVTLADLRSSLAPVNVSDKKSEEEVEFDLRSRSIGIYPIHFFIKPYLHSGLRAYKDAENIAGSKGCNVEHPCTFIELVGENGDWGGTDDKTDRRLDDNTSRTRLPQRVGW